MQTPPDSLTERSGWSQWLERLVAALLGIAVTVIGALLIGALQQRDPNLTFSSVEALPFLGPSGEISIYQVTISNDGKKDADDVVGVIQIPGGKISQSKITASPTLNVSSSLSSDDSLTVQVSSLNPSESFQVSLLADGIRGLPSRPQVSMRGKGVIGKEKNPVSAKLGSDSSLLVTMGAASAVMSSSLFMLLLRRRSIGRVLGGDDQRQVLAYLCRAYDLTSLADQYSNQTHETTYWTEADRLGHIATSSENDPKKIDAIEKLLLALVEFHSMAPNSKAIVLYNVALINNFRNDEAACKKYLDLAQRTSSYEIRQRLKVDPRFNSQT